jgi:hypothetical protein
MVSYRRLFAKWRAHRTDFSHLAKLAMKYLSALPATSALSEHVLSTAGLIIAKDRSQMETSHAKELMVLNESVPTLNKYYAVIKQKIRQRILLNGAKLHY